MITVNEIPDSKSQTDDKTFERDNIVTFCINFDRGSINKYRIAIRLETEWNRNFLVE